ncbi:MAG: hypothetical protein JRM99_05470 [Nitrososphaerota archaeon]|nr:hypothetical protein [Nitrososphaerota archaeon]MDG6990853.1 hypothetical protein [Nitrososphaerota archaeon]
MGIARKAGRQEISFTIQTIECVACTPVFSRNLRKLLGVLEVKELPITNKIIVAYDGALLDRDALEAEIRRISKGAGFGDKIIVHR